MRQFSNRNLKILFAAAALSLTVCLPINARAVSFTAGEAEAEEQKGFDAPANGAEEQDGLEAPLKEEDENGQEGENDLNLSSDADLKLLHPYPGSLTPSFSPEVTEYSFLLEDNNMASVGLDVEAADKKAKIIAMSGFSNLKVGENLAVLTVKAEDGTTKSYRVRITRNQGEVEADQVETPEPVTAEGYIATGQENFVVHGSFPEEMLPDGCTKVEYIYKGNYIDAAYFDEGELMLLYASEADGSNGDFYVYYSGSNEFFGFVPIKSSNGLVVFPVQYPTGIPIPNYFVEASVELSGKTVAGYLVSESAFEEEQEYMDMEIQEEESAYTLPEITDYFLFFGISSNGNKGWYLYDTIEHTCQRYLDLTASTDQNYFDEESYVVYKKKSQQRMVIICVLVFLLFLAFVVLLNQFLKIRELKDGCDEDEEEPDNQEKAPPKAVQRASEERKPERKPEKKEKEKKKVADKEQEEKIKQKVKKEKEAEQTLSPDLDDDFEFEFIDINR
ncbi:MAG: cadherin-like beta sandwich domain-containing protein [Lachnospiraceae bacterium]|nr:cadherin-like beta sandwich domain-containing protein [Lachnospiraceae bacterium]